MYGKCFDGSFMLPFRLKLKLSDSARGCRRSSWISLRRMSHRAAATEVGFEGLVEEEEEVASVSEGRAETPTVLDLADKWLIPLDLTTALLEALGVPTEALVSTDLHALGCIDEADFKEVVKEVRLFERKLSLIQRGQAMKLFKAEIGRASVGKECFD